MVQGEGVWWHKESDGSFHFHDGSDYAVFSDAGPQLLHFRNARLDDVLRRSNACWHEALEKKISLPIEVVRHYNSCGYVSEIAVTDKPTVSSSPEVSFDGSFVIPSLPPLVCLTPLSQNDVPEAASSEANEQPEEVQTRDGYTLQGSVQSVDTEGFVDLADEEVRNDQHSTLQSSMCQALGRLLGITKELQQFDCVRCLCKRKGKRALPVELKKHQAFIRYFRKQITMHKRSLDCRLAQLAASSVEYNQCAKEIRHCLQLLCKELF